MILPDIQHPAPQGFFFAFLEVLLVKAAFEVFTFGGISIWRKKPWVIYRSFDFHRSASPFDDPGFQHDPAVLLAIIDRFFQIGFRLFADLATGVRYLAGEALVGASMFYDGTKAVRLIAG